MKCFATTILACVLFSPTTAWSQAGSSTIRGEVHDQAHAAVPGAKVILTNTATSVARENQTNDAGLYAFPAVIPGSYRIAVEFPGLQKFEGNLTVQTAQDATVDVTLQVAQAATTVDVQDVTPMLQVDSASLGHVLERQRIEQLPLLGRGYQNLLQTVPAVMWRVQASGIGGRMQGYGLQVGANSLVFDGAPMNEVYGGWDFGRPPDLDTLQELHIEVNGASAKFSRPTTVVMSSRSGTNQFHGSLFETNRNSAYGVARRREDYYAKPPYVNRNEYGVSAGGPVIIPKVYNGRNRTFWFFGWEGTRYLSYRTTRASVPTEAMKNGDFSGLVDATGRLYTIYDPLTTDSKTWQRQPFAYNGILNTIDPSRLSPTAKFIFNVTKPPTHPQINPLLDANWIGLTDRPLEQDTHSIRIDHRISDKDLLYGRFGYNTNYETVTSPTVDLHPLFQKIGGIQVIEQAFRWWPNHSLSTTWVHTFSSTMTNEVVATGNRDYNRQGAGDLKTNYAALLGLPNPFNAVNWTVFTGMNLGTFTLGGNAPSWQISDFITLQDNATKVAGKHEFQFGFHFRFEDLPQSVVSTAGPFDVATQATSLYDSTSTASNPIARPLTGHEMANLYLGVMNYNAQFRRPWSFMRRKEYAPYIQDNWKVTPRLSLNLGLRYEVRTPIHDRNDLLVSFDLDKRAYVLGSDLSHFIQQGATLPSIVTAFQNYGGKIITYRDVGLPQNLAYLKKDFGPRLGFAYRALDGRKAFVVRGGYRISYYTQPVSNWFSSQTGPALVSTGFQYSVTNTALSPDGLPNFGLRSVPTYTAGVNTPSSIINTNDGRLLTRGSFAAINLDSHLADPKVHDWNFTLEKEVMANTVARVALLGNRTVNIQQTVNFNSSTPAYIWYAAQKQPLPPGEFANVAIRPYDQQVYGNVDGYRSSGYAWFNGIQLELERRFAKGVGYQIFYVLNNSRVATGTIAGLNNFLPGAVPSDSAARNRLLNYQVDGTSPKHQVRWNFIVDLPFGRGKLLGNNGGRWLDKIIGGWQIAGTGNWTTTYWTLPTNVYPTTGQDIELYGYKYPIQDCRSGACFPGYLWWNGYIPPNRINSYDANGKPNGVMGVPTTYKSAGQPLIPWGSTALPPNAPAGTNLTSLWDTNTVWVPLNNGSVQRTTYNDNLHPWRNQYRFGPAVWVQDASLFKSVNLTEKVRLRFNVDFFNVFNHPTNFYDTRVNVDVGPTTMDDGILSVRNSGIPARVMQLSLRLTW